MAMFIRVEVDPSVVSNPDLAKKLTEVCPVDIYGVGPDGKLVIVEKNLDECTLCDLCIEAGPPGTVHVVKLYEQ